MEGISPASFTNILMVANPSADKEDVLQAADILLKMSGGTEVKNIPNPAVKEDTPQDGVKGQ